MMSTKDSWIPASQPPDSHRSVLVWMELLRAWSVGFFINGQWYADGFSGECVTHWQDVVPPNGESS